MSNEQTYFEQVVGDAQDFQLMLDGAFKDWPGSYDVLLAQTDQYLYSPKNTPVFRRFCRILRSKPEGETRCKTCDINAAKRAYKSKSPLTYECHAGLLDFAIPITLNNDLLATIFCGQILDLGTKYSQNATDKVKKLEAELGFVQGELLDAWYEIPEIPEGIRNNTINRVWRLVNYVSRLGIERLETKKALEKEKQRLVDSELIEDSVNTLSEIEGSWDSFWEKVDDVLKNATEKLHSASILFLVPDDELSDSNRLIVKALSGLPSAEFKDRVYPGNDQLFNKVIREKEVYYRLLTKLPEPDTVCASIHTLEPDIAKTLKSAILLRTNVGNHKSGILVIFFNFELDDREIQNLKKERSTLIQFSYILGRAYHNTLLFQQQKGEIEYRKSWIKRVTHQLISPLHGIQGYADLAWTQLSRWKYDENIAPSSTEEPQKLSVDITKWAKSFESVKWSSHYAARLARNLLWSVSKQERENLFFEPLTDASGFLIKCARDFQAMAKIRGLRGVSVNTETTEKINGRICISSDLFRQAVENLLDNAVKYSDKGTLVVISSVIRDNNAFIVITNVGIQLNPNEVDNIFQENYRTLAAQKKFPTGTGIGLTVAKEIINLHNGTLKAIPSNPTGNGWRTEFQIIIPLVTGNCD